MALDESVIVGDPLPAILSQHATEINDRVISDGRVLSITKITKVALGNLTNRDPTTAYYVVDDINQPVVLYATATNPGTTDPSAPSIPTAGGIPATILNIGPGATQNHFKVQVAPTDGTRFVEHTQTDIFNGYEEAPYFVRSADGTAVSFAARADAPTTSGTTYARAELREMQADGSTNAAWNANVGTHEMSGTSRIMSVPAQDPDVVIAQVHNGDSDRIAIRTQVFTNAPGVPQLVVRINGTVGSPAKVHLNPYTFGTWVQWKIRIVNGAVSVFLDNMTTPKFTAPAGTLAATTAVNSWYFKAGAYNQFSEASAPATSFSVVELKGLDHSHS